MKIKIRISFSQEKLKANFKLKIYLFIKNKAMLINYNSH